MRVAIGQFMATTEVSENLKEIETLIGQSASAGAELVVLPEAAMRFIGPPGDRIEDYAQSLEGPFVTAIRECSKEHKIAVVVGMFESTTTRQSGAFNTVVAVGSNGSLIGAYRKIHLFDALGVRESDRVIPGDGSLLVFGIGDLTFGVMTCYDIRFPEIGRALIDEGANVLIVPTAWRHGILKESQWLTLAEARALENTCWLVGSAQVDGAYSGNSVVIDPMGTTVARLGEESGILVAEISADRVARVREKLPVLENRRYKVAFSA